MADRSPTPVPPDNPPAVFRFGVFEADARSGELHKSGRRVRLQEQPFQILLVLLQQPGEVVSRQDLRQRLWSDETFVDFDHSLNTGINKLREALGDSAGNPRFIETLARRGYRFIAPVEMLDRGPQSERAPVSKAVEEVVPEPTAEQPGASDSAPTTGTPPPPEPGAANSPVADELPQPARKVSRSLFSLAQLLYLIFYVVALVRLEEVHEIVAGWRPDLGTVVTIVILVTAPIGIAVRLYLLSAAGFDHSQLGHNFRRLFPLVLPLDQLWALAPFLLLPQIGLGGALAATAALLYLPFSERTLIRMAYRYA